MSLEDKVIDIVCKTLSQKKENVKLNSSFVNDLGADSLDTVELVMALEEAFGITIPTEDSEKIQTVGSAVNYIKEKGGK
jgi:acyl carrier protein